MFITMLGLFWGLKFYRYYVYPLLFFIIISLISIMSISHKLFDKLYVKKYSYLLYIAIFLICLFLSYQNANYREMIGMKKEEMFQYRYADYINQFTNPTLLNMGYLDAGLYTTTGIVPNTKFFEVQNIPYDNFPDNLDEMKKNVENKEVMFILYFTKKSDDVAPRDQYIYDNYELVKKETQQCEEDIYYALLFQRKD